VLRFALHRQGQNSDICTRCHAHGLPRFTAGTAKQCRAWLSPNRPQRIPFHRQAYGFPPGPRRPGFHPWRNPMIVDHKSWDQSSGADLDELRRLAKKAVLPGLLASFLAATAADSRTRVDELRFVV